MCLVVCGRKEEYPQGYWKNMQTRHRKALATFLNQKPFCCEVPLTTTTLVTQGSPCLCCGDIKYQDQWTFPREPKLSEERTSDLCSTEICLYSSGFFCSVQCFWLVKCACLTQLCYNNNNFLNASETLSVLQEHCQCYPSTSWYAPIV